MADNATVTETDKKWKWDRDKQETRNELIADTYFRDLCYNTVEQSDSGATITDALRYVLSNLSTDESHKKFLSLSRIDQRLVVRKILHTKYKSGAYTLVESDSKYRTGKKSGTLRYVLAQQGTAH